MTKFQLIGHPKRPFFDHLFSIYRPSFKIDPYIDQFLLFAPTFFASLMVFFCFSVSLTSSFAVFRPIDEMLVRPIDEMLVRPIDEMLVRPIDEMLVRPIDERLVRPIDEMLVHLIDDNTTFEVRPNNFEFYFFKKSSPKGPLILDYYHPISINSLMRS